MLRSVRARLVRGAGAALLAGALGGACGSSPPTDRNFGSNLGADFRAPHIDAGSDTNVTLDGAAGTSGAAGTGAAGSSGAAGAGGSTVDSGAGGVRDASGVEAGG
jgi:hypothetical protein